MEDLVEVIQEHAKVFDQKCLICQHPQRTLLEKWYMQRRPMTELISIFGFPEQLFHLHGRATKLFKKRANNTAAIVNLVLENGMEALKAGHMELTIKDLAWAVGHRDKLLGRIKDRVDINVPPILHLHTTIPGVGGIADVDVKEIKAAEIREQLPSARDIIIEAEEVIEKKENA